MHLHRKEPEGNALLLNVAYQVASRIYFPSPYFLFIHDFKIFNTERVRLITYQNNTLKFRGKEMFFWSHQQVIAFQAQHRIPVPVYPRDIFPEVEFLCQQKD